MPRVARIGLDIGSSAVRAAEVVATSDGSEIRRFAQVGLPSGAVVEGEIRDQAAVIEAVKRLWVEGGFKQKEVVVGISSQRAMVRQVELPQLASGELRSALRYEIGELLPIPLEQATFDFAVLGPGQPRSDGAATTQVLVVVAQKDIVWDAVNVVRKAGLRVRAVDSSPLAMVRAIPAAQAGALEAVVSIGSQLAVVAVREGQIPRFIRTVTLGGDTPAPVTQTAGAGARAAGNSRRSSGAGPGTDPRARLSFAVEEIRGSLEYFLSHGEGSTLSVISLTGGGSLLERAAQEVGATIGVPVRIAQVSSRFDQSTLGLTEEQVKEASSRWTSAVGLALWGTDGSPAPSLLPKEIQERARLRTVYAGAAAGLLVVAGGLGVVSHARSDTAAGVSRQVVAEQAQVASLNVEILKLESETRIVGEVNTRRQEVASVLADDIDFVGLYGRIIKALPKGMQMGNIALSSSVVSLPAGSTPGIYVGQITMTVQTSGGAPAVAGFVEKMSTVKGVGAVWVSSSASGSSVASVKSGPVGWSFGVTADITTQALSTRAAQVLGAKP